MSQGGAVGFAGLSHLGIIYSMAAAAHGFSVVAFDERPGLAAGLTAGRFPIEEPGLVPAFEEHRERIRYTDEPAALTGCPLIFITLDVATDESNQSDLGPLEALVQRVTSTAAPGTVIAIMSQVPPGFCRNLTSRIPQFQLYYQVETLVFGNAMERATKPERFMVGCAQPSDALPPIYRRYLETFGCPVLPMRYESAELCKIAINCFLVSSVSTSNTLAELCEKIGADWLEIVPALRLDRRIGPHAYLMPGLGIAGGNLERDLVTVQRLASEYGSDARVVTAWQQNSEYRRDWVLRRLFSLGALRKGPEARLAILGIAYKANTNSTKNSPALALINALRGYRIQTYDPAVKIDPAEFPGVTSHGSALESAAAADALMIMAPWNEFRDLSLAEVKQSMKGNHVLDPFGALDEGSCRQLGFDYHRMGV